jgi:hypothetical protein
MLEPFLTLHHRELYCGSIRILQYFVQIDSHASRIPLSISKFGTGHVLRSRLSDLPSVTQGGGTIRLLFLRTAKQPRGGSNGSCTNTLMAGFIQL